MKIKVAKSNTLKNFHSAILMIIPFLLISLPTVMFAQDAGSATETRDFITTNLENIMIGLLVIILGVFLFGMIVIGDKLIKISIHRTGKQGGIDEDELESKYRFFPRLLPTRGAGRKGKVEVIRLEEGFDIYIKGVAKEVIRDIHPNTVSLRPESFKGMSPIPKLAVEIGDEVKAGDAIFFDKKRPEIMYTSPVSGEVLEVRRGEKRKIVDVVILADKDTKYKDFGVTDIASLGRDIIVERMLESGTWPLIRQRPYDIVADPNDSPKMIWISCFDTSPLAPDYDFIMKGDEKAFEAGLEILKKLTEQDVHLGLNAKKMHSEMFLNAHGVKKHFFEGPHPAGNVGIQIHHVNPINKGDIVWYVNPQDVAVIGRLFLHGKFDARKIVALAGSEVKEPQYFKTYLGGSIEPMVKDNLLNDHVRYISGNVLTGLTIQDGKGHLGFYHNLCTVIAEGDQYEFFGWLMPSYPRPTFNPSFLSYYFHGEEHRVDTNAHGEERAFVQTGIYEKVLPMNIYPTPLFKSILIQDFEKMEGLGIYEISEEDVALCEFVCPSKIDIQHIVREGLDLMRTQG